MELERLEVLTASADLGTYSLSSKSISFTGIVVEADEAVAVESGSFRVSMSRDAEADLLWTGLEPVELWGWDHVTFPTPSDTSSAEVGDGYNNNDFISKTLFHVKHAQLR